MSNGKESLHACVVEMDPSMVQFFEPNTSRSDAYRFNDVTFELLPEDFACISLFCSGFSFYEHFNRQFTPVVFYI